MTVLLLSSVAPNKFGKARLSHIVGGARVRMFKGLPAVNILFSWFAICRETQHREAMHASRMPNQWRTAGHTE